MILLLHSAAAFSSVNPHIVIILVDDMGYGDLACFNPESKIPTPQIDRLAASGMRFTDAHAPGPLCHVSRYGLLTGRYPFRTTFEWQTEPVIKEDEVTIASFLKTQGYQTAMVGKWHLGFKQDAEDDYTGVLTSGPIVMAANNTMLIRSGDWKLIDSLRSGGFSPKAADDSSGAKGQLYNLKDDPGERNNLWLRYPERVAKLSEQLAQIKREPKTRN
tara:strand:- start:1720 stop:2370 length:651 start_codon:yes stop_codon:yes gene_type:complete